MDPIPTSTGTSAEHADIFEHLHRDHQNGIRLLEQLDHAVTAHRRDLLFADLKSGLAAHVKAEEAVFYKALEHAANELVTESRYEHKNITALLERLDGLRKDGDEWTTTVAELRKAVKHHIQRDESELFPAARQILTNEQAYQLVSRMAEGEVESKAIAGESHAFTREGQTH